MTFWWRAENSTTLDATLDHTTGDNVATATGSVSFDVAAVKNGTYGVLGANTNSYYTFDISSDDIIDASKGCVATWFNPVTWPGGGRELIAFRAPSGTNQQIRLYINGSSGARTLSMAVTDGANASCTGSGTPYACCTGLGTGSCGTTTVTTTSNSVTLNTMHFAVGCWDVSQAAGNDTIYVEIYNTSLSLISGSYNTAATMGDITPGQLTLFRYGSTNGSGANNLYLDHALIYTSPTASPTTCANQANYDGS
jgi:hypothetical protein